MDKKGQKAPVWIMVSLLVAVVGILAFAGWNQGWFTPQTTQADGEVDDETKAIATATKLGNVATFRVSVQDNNPDSAPTRFAGTVYCQKSDVLDPNQPLVSGGSITTSATAGTTLSPTNVGDTVTCVEFSASHRGIPETTLVGDSNGDGVFQETDEVLLSSNNISGTMANTYYVEFFEDGTIEAGRPSISMPASSETTDFFDEIRFRGNASGVGFFGKVICFGSNATANSEMKLIELRDENGVAYPTAPNPYRYRNTHDFCQEFPDAQAFYDDIFDYGVVKTGQLRITTTTDWNAIERINWTIADECNFRSVGDGIGIGVQTDTSSPADCGAPDLSGDFDISNV